jgi:hypothetical protein
VTSLEVRRLGDLVREAMVEHEPHLVARFVERVTPQLLNLCPPDDGSERTRGVIAGVRLAVDVLRVQAGLSPLEGA